MCPASTSSFIAFSLADSSRRLPSSIDTYLSLPETLALQDSFSLDVFALPTASSTKSYLSPGSSASTWV